MSNIEVTDLEQLAQFSKFHVQMGMFLKQVTELQTRIGIAELLEDQKELGLEVEPEDVDALRAQMIVCYKSLRNRSAAFIREVMEISERGRKTYKRSDGNGTSEPPPAPPPEPVAVTEAPVAPEEDTSIEFDIQ